MTTIIHRASLEDIKPVGWSNRQPAQLYAQLNRIIQAALPRQRALFAEPVYGDDGYIDYHTAPFRDCRCYSEISDDDERALLDGKIGSAVAAVRRHWQQLGAGEDKETTRHNLHDALQSIFTIPSTDYIYEVDGEPIVVCWTFTQNNNQYLDLNRFMPLMSEDSPEPEPYDNTDADDIANKPPIISMPWWRKKRWWGLLLLLLLLLLGAWLRYRHYSNHLSLAERHTDPVHSTAVHHSNPSHGNTAETTPIRNAPEDQSWLQDEQVEVSEVPAAAKLHQAKIGIRWKAANYTCKHLDLDLYLSKTANSLNPNDYIFWDNRMINGFAQLEGDIQTVNAGESTVESIIINSNGGVYRTQLVGFIHPYSSDCSSDVSITVRALVDGRVYSKQMSLHVDKGTKGRHDFATGLPDKMIDFNLLFAGQP